MARSRKPTLGASLEFDPVLWHPAHGEAAFLFAHLGAPVAQKVSEALQTHLDLLGYPRFRPADLALPALVLALGHVVLCETRVIAGGRPAVLQSLGGMLCRSHVALRSMDPRAAWSLLATRAFGEFAPPPAMPWNRKRTFVTNRFLEAYGMGGAANLDAVMAISRMIGPHLEAARAGLELPEALAPDRYLVRDSSPAAVAVERRRAPRMRRRLTVWVEPGHIEAVTEDVSDSGLFASAGRAYSTGTVVRVTGDGGDGEPVQAIGVVQWVRDAEPGKAGETRGGMGIGFGSTSADFRRFLQLAPGSAEAH